MSIASTGRNRFRVMVNDDGQTRTFEGGKITFSFVAARSQREARPGWRHATGPTPEPGHNGVVRF